MVLSKKYERVVKSNANELSKEQQEILYYLINERLTPSKIGAIRGTSRQAVNKTILKLKKKGVIKEVTKSNYQEGGSYPKTNESNNKEYRLHAQSFSVGIIESSTFYLNLLKTRNKHSFDNNTLMLYEDKIIIYSNKDFWGSSVNQSVRGSLNYWENFLTKIENRFKVLLTKREKSVIRQFKGEIAKVGDTLAKKINLSENVFRIYLNGELKLIVDKSFKFNELEAVHKETYIEDMQNIESFYSDTLTNGNVWEVVKAQLSLNSKQQQQHNEVLLMLKTLTIEVQKIKDESRR